MAHLALMEWTPPFYGVRRLPAIAPDLGTWHRVSVHRDCHVQFDRSFYSVPLEPAPLV